jgi:periplasmic glucans biosynthesis protein
VLQWRGHWADGVTIPRLARVAETRAASRAATSAPKVAGEAPQKLTQVTYAIDFLPPTALPLEDVAQIIPFFEVDADALMLARSIKPNPKTKGWRVEAEIAYPEATKSSELSCTLLLKGWPVSEKWNFAWRR